MKKRKVLQASFNLADTFEAGLLEYVLAQGDVSKYIKRLIYVDKEGLRKGTVVTTIVADDVSDAIDDAMDSVSL